MSTIFGTNSADALRGTASADAIYGFWGDDSIRGGDGRDFIYAGNGDDTVDGGAGSNVLDGGGGFDLVLYSEMISPIWADLRSGIVSFSGQTGDTMTGIEAIDGGTGRDTFIGDGASNLFRGNAGNDTLTGNFGSDTLVGGIGSDSLDGGNGQDSIVGGFGDDTMRGGLHDDIFFIGPITRDSTSNIIDFIDYGRDLIDGGGGTDTLFVDGPTGYAGNGDDQTYNVGAPSVRANLATGTLRIGESDNRSTLISIENIETGSGDDSINGGAADNLIRAGGGQNVVFAGLGNDTIIGGSGTYTSNSLSLPVEILNGGAGDDAIYGMGSETILDNAVTYTSYPGQDVFVGGAGNDTLYGGAAMQTMTGGEGNDVFVLTDDVVGDYYGRFPGHDLEYFYAPATITDFERGGDTIQFDFAATFVGEADPDSLEMGEFGYHRSGSDTLLEVRFADYSDDLTSVLTITLTGYTGSLSAGDFDLA